MRDGVGLLTETAPAWKFEKLFLHTGNIIFLNELKRKVGQTPSDELVASLRTILSTWHTPTDMRERVLHVHGSHTGSSMTLNPEGRKDLKVTVKVFVQELKTLAVQEALECALSELGTDYIESVILACPVLPDDEKLELSHLMDLWNVLQTYVQQQKLLSIGISDLNVDLFLQLYEWAQVKPSSVQISVTSCCVVPPRLATFTKEHDIQLLTHSDAPDILPQAALQEVLTPYLDSNIQSLKPYWLVRFQVHVKCRGVLQNKGYVVCAQRAT